MARLWFVLVSVLALRVASPARFPNILPTGGWWSARAGDVQVVYLPALLPRQAQAADDATHDDVPLKYSFDAFGRNFDLQLVPNRRLLSPSFRVFSQAGEDPSLSAVDASCHFIHTSPGAVAAFSACRDHALHGLIVTNNSAYEVQPLKSGTGRSREGDGRTAHIIRRAPPPTPLHDDARPLRSGARHPRAWPNRPPPKTYTIEIALFLDEAAYKIFYPLMNYNEADLRDMLLAYINGVQALYHHPSLGTPIQLSLVRLTLLRSQPSALSADGERESLLDTFCAYQRSLNVEDDDDPDHWDMALLLSGLDIYTMNNGVMDTVTMGLAPVGGVCLPAHACVVTEFGAADRNARPYPSAGFTSVYILAHEMGHNLGMHHDGTGNSCSRDGYVMSPSRGTRGEATWSACSAKVAANLQWATCLFDGDEDGPNRLPHDRHGDTPGELWGAKRQCEVLLRDRDASPTQAAGSGGYGAAGGADVCEQLVCRTPHRIGHYNAGPALPGTACGPGKWCQGGECVTKQSVAPDEPRPMTEDPPAGDTWGEWGEWETGACRSGCTLKGRGAVERRRACPAGGCAGSSYDVVLCDDTKVCGKKKRSGTSELAARRCSEYALKLPELDRFGGGLQAPHDPMRLWMGCAVFCRRAGSGGFYAPRVELNGAGLDPYLPDGTWCHNDGRTQYYCMQHHCLPENFKISTQFHIWELPGEDVEGSFNARARSDDSEDVFTALRSYFSLDENGKPFARSVMPPQLPEDVESDWEVKDYVEIDRNVTMA